MLHGNTGSNGCASFRNVREQLDEDGVVEHGVVEQKLLLCLRQVLVSAHAPAVVAEEPRESLVVGGEHGLRTCLCQCLGIAQVLNEFDIVVKCTGQHVLVRIF